MPDELRAGRQYEKPLCRPLALIVPLLVQAAGKRSRTSLQNASRALGSCGDECARPLRTKVAMLTTVKAIDPHPIRRVLRPALLTARIKIQRHWRALGL